MNICPLCNGISQPTIGCSVCGEGMHNNGRMSDFYDDYSAYMDMETMKVVDEKNENEECVHVFTCLNCSQSILRCISLTET
ncbi:hypothetical protein [Bacillus sp. 2205SS5-2]|uniref:hypothetical protein n=1 Tax=Bacillus sp. 2205SS5-2 TaxID=3109031 RepID=UPI00300672C5